MNLVMSILRLSLALLLVLGGAGASGPSVVEQDGDLYLQESGRTVRLTSYGRNQDPVVSPDGRWVAYLSFPAWVQGGGYLATNVWVMNLKTRAARRLAYQPRGAPGGGPYVCRDLLVWSNDSQTLLWFEWRLGSAEKPGPTYLVIQAVSGDRRREVRVRLAPGMTGWDEDHIFPALLGIGYDGHWQGDTLSLNVTQNRTGTLPPLRVTVDVGTGVLREVR